MKKRYILLYIILTISLCLYTNAADFDETDFMPEDNGIIENTEAETEITEEYTSGDEVIDNINTDYLNDVNENGEDIITVSFSYDKQPEKTEEVTALIDEYNARYYEALNTLGFAAAMDVIKPRWEFEVDKSLMPTGYSCLPFYDELLDIWYFTFFADIELVIENIPSADSYTNLLKEINAAPKTAAENDLPYVIEITGNIYNFGAPITIPAGANIILRSAENEIFKLSKTENGRHFIVAGILTLENIIIDGNANSSALATKGGVQVNSGGAFIMEKGTVIENCYNISTSVSSNCGGGVQVNANGYFYMNGGEINNNAAKGYGGAVYAAAGGNVVINNGIINGNASEINGGGIYGYTGSKIYINNGEIINNTALTSGGGIYGFNESVIYINGGRISGNKASGTTSSSGGGGIYGIKCTVEVSGNTIIGGESDLEGNSADYGGGIYVYNSSTVNIGGNAKISYNTAKSGGGIGCVGSSVSSGGINLNRCIITIGGFAEVSHNKATSYNGGAVFATTTNSAFTQPPHIIQVEENALIYANEAEANGGGIFVYETSIVNVTGGEIKKNKAKNGGGIFGSFTSSVNVSDTALITENEASLNGGGIYSDGHNILDGVSVYVTGGEINGNTAANGGGGIYVVTNIGDPATPGGSGSYRLYSKYTDVIINGGVIANNSALNGGGIGTSCGSYNGSSNEATCNITINGGAEIVNNTALSNGGGVYGICTSTNAGKGYCNITVLDNALISENKAVNGGGIACLSNTVNGANEAFSKFIINGGEINGNTASSNGGGIYVNGVSAKVYYELIQNGGLVINNTALGKGGGIYGNIYGSILADSGVIAKNYGTSGGGIYTEDAAYKKLTVNNEAAFYENTAAALYAPPINATEAYYWLKPESVSVSFESEGINNHPLNNYDINFLSGSLYYLITYNANGGTGHIGSQPVKVNTEAALYSGEVFENRSHTLTGWAKTPNGNADYELNGIIPSITENITLYAVWQEQPPAEIVNEYSKQPDIFDVTEGDVFISGTGIPGAEITVTFPDGSIEATLVDENGEWSVPVPYDINLSAGDLIIVSQTENGKLPSNEAETTVLQEIGSPTETTPDETDETKLDETEPDETEPNTGNTNNTGGSTETGNNQYNNNIINTTPSAPEPGVNSIISKPENVENAMPAIPVLNEAAEATPGYELNSDSLPEYPPDFQLVQTDNNTVELDNTNGEITGQWVAENDGWEYYGNQEAAQPVPEGDGSFTIIEPDGTPDGLWVKDENDEWIYEEYPNINLTNILAGLLVLAGLLAVIYLLALRRYVTRGEFVQMVVRTVELFQEEVNAQPYKDVSKDSKYYKPVASACAAGILSGFTEDKFNPNKEITREEISSVLAGTIRYKTEQASLAVIDLKSEFSDYNLINEVYAADIILVTQLGIIDKMPGGRFKPKAFSTKKQAEAVIEKLKTSKSSGE